MSFILKSFAGTFLEVLAGLLKDFLARQDQKALGTATERADQAQQGAAITKGMAEADAAAEAAGGAEKSLSDGSF